MYNSKVLDNITQLFFHNQDDRFNIFIIFPKLTMQRNEAGEGKNSETRNHAFPLCTASFRGIINIGKIGNHIK